MPNLRAVAAFSLILAALTHAGPALATWTSDSTLGVGVVVTPGDQSLPTMVSDGSGGFLLLWTDYRKPTFDPDLYCQRVSAEGDSLWGSGGVAVCDAAGIQSLAMLVADGSGGAFVAWMDARTSNPGYYVQHLGPNGVRRWAANGIRPVSGFNSQAAPRICRDGTGGIYLAFASGSPGTQVQRIDSLGIKQLPFTFPAEGPLIRANPSAPMAILADGSGGAIVAVTYGDIMAQRVNSAGAFQWGASGVTVVAAAGDQSGGNLVSDGSGGAIVAWNDSRVAAGEIYAQRVSSAGSALWTANGVPVCVATGLQSGVQIVPLAGGESLVAWLDSRSAFAIYAQRLGANGAFAWTADGNKVCEGSQAISRFSLVAGRGDSSLVAWNTSPRSPGDVFAQKLDGAGTRLWGEYGATVCRGPNSQIDVCAAADTCGGLFVAYRDGRVTSDPDLHAQRLGPDGLPGPKLVSVPTGEPFASTRLRGVPNPARGIQTLFFSRPVTSGARAEVMDVAGRRVHAAPLQPGASSWTWDGRDRLRARVQAGIYLVRIVDSAGVAVAHVVRLD